LFYPITDGGEEAPVICTFIKKKRPQKNMRKRKADDGGEEEDQTTINRGKMAEKKGLSSTTKVADRQAEAVGQWSSDRKVTSSINAVDNATRTIDVDTAQENDAEAIWKRSKKLKEEMAANGNLDDGIYRGQAGYQTFTKLDPEEQFSSGCGGPTKGPARRPDNVRESVRFDYAPDICKDYRDTGFCGFGDSCKFMHDRGDYKAGWQIEKEYQDTQKEKERRIRLGLPELDEDEAKEAAAKEDGEIDDGLPFACLICRGPFKEPMVTKCEHYFCNSCAMKEFKKSPHCFACKVHTGGVFNVAHNIIAKIKKLETMGLTEEGKKKNEEADDAGGSSEDEEKTLQEYYEKTKKRGDWRPKKGTEGWMLSGTTFHGE